MSEISDKTREMLNQIVDLVVEGCAGDAVVGATSLCLAVHFFCEATGYEHESFIKNLKHLRDRDK
jgi:hypothetical protein